MLVGIARLAAEAPALERKRRVDYFHLGTRTLLNRCANPKLPFTWTVNPYRGCEFGCKYCYARSTHEYLELRRLEDFETRIYAKNFTASGLRGELARVKRGQAIAIGTATDPYQPAERRFRLTRRVLGVFAEARGYALSVTTKSDLIARDVDVLARIAERNSLMINMTVTTVDAELARAVEPYAPRPDLRLGAVRELARAGINVGVFVSPLMPRLNDSLASLRAVAEAARQAGAVRFGARVLFLTAAPKECFLEWVGRERRELLAMYERYFSRGSGLPPDYETEAREVVRRVREEAGFPGTVPGEAAGAQMELFT
ncbi:MAG: radical SAM protein [Bryobacteraceae bacterium]|nr:radical SAM protein [Bryobacteraceae bacterium]